MSKSVGMSRNINLDWLDKTANLVIEGKNEKEIKKELNDYLSLHINDKTNLNKTINILAHIWGQDNDDNDLIRQLALSIVGRELYIDRLVAHWCMMLVTYPVFFDVSATIGKINDKQLEITSSLIRKRMQDSWGERTTMIHAIPKNIKTMKDIGVLHQRKIGKNSVKEYEVKDGNVAILIIATLIQLKDKLYVSLDELNNCKEVFPFKYEINIEEIQDSGLFSFDK